MCLLMLMMVEDGPRADGLQIVSGNYYHWCITKVSIIIIILGGTCPHLFFLYVLFHLQYRPWMAGVDGDGGTEVRLMMVEDGG